MRRLPLLALAAALACSTEVTPKNPYDPATPLPLQAKARVAGTVETGAGAPFAGLTVYLRQNGQLVRNFTTDGAGAFVFDALTPGGYSVEAQAPGFAPLAVPLTLAAGADVDVGALAMTPLGGLDTGALRGVARLGKLAAVPGGPVEEDTAADHGGILIEAVGSPYAAVTTSTGDYELSLPPGTHTLRVSKPSFVAQTLPDQQVTLGAVTPVVVVILATNPAKVTGQVVAELPGGGTGPLADALVTLDGTSATGLTNAAGQFTLDQLAPGSYLLRVLKAGYATASVPVLNLDGGEERVLAEPLSLSLERGAIRGRVILADTPADASGAVVEVTGTGRAAVTGADGAFAFDALVAGTYEVRARKDGYAQQVAGGLAVAAGGVVDVPPLTLVRQGGTVTIAEGAVTRLTTVTLQLGAPAAAGFRASEDPAFADPALGDVATSPARPYGGPGSTAPFTLSGADGLHTVYVSFVDASGGASAPASAAIVLDRAAPVSPSVVIGGGAAYLSSPTAGLALSAQDLPAVAGAAVSGLEFMELADDAAFAVRRVRLPYNLAYTHTLDGADGIKAVYARFIDRAGNVSATAVALVTLDRLPPQSPTIALSGGAGAPAGTASSPLVTATLSATDENEGSGKQNLQVRLSNSLGFAGATWQPYAPSVSWLLPPGDGTRTVYAQFMDPAGNVSDPDSDTIAVSGTAPTGGRLVVAGGAAATNQQVVPVAVSATGAAEMRLSVDGVPQPAGWVPYAATATVDLGASAAEVTRTVSVAFRNGAGLEGGAASASVVLDQRAPTGASVAVNGGAATTASLSVTLALAALDAPAAAGGVSAGLDVVEISNDGFLTSTTSPMVSTLSWTLAAGGDGPRTVSARFRDKAGNASAPVSATIAYDHTAPSGPAIALSGGASSRAGYTGSPVVTATLTASDANDGGAGKPNLQMRLSTDAGFAGAPWQPYAASVSFALPGGDGPKTVHAQFRDAAGNESLVASATISLAATPPSAGSIALPAATSAQVVTATLSATGADRMLISVNGVPQAAGWIPYATTASVDLGASPDEATRGVSVLFRNAGGVDGAAAATSTVMDRTAPTVTAGSLRLNGGAAFTGSTSVSVSLGASDGPVAGTAASGLAWVELSNDGTAWTQLPWAGSVAWTLAAAGGDGARTVWARVRDRAGNVSTPAVSASIFLDRTGPTAAAPVLAGNATAKAGYTGTPVVAVTVSATDPSEGTGKADLQVQLGNDSNFSGSTWQPYATQLSWVLPVGDGPKTVWVRFKDGVGNVSTPVSATINLMETPPSAGTIAVAGGAAVTNQLTVPVHVSAVNADRMLLYVNGVAQPAGWVAYAPDTTVDLGASPDETVRTVSVVFRNAGGVDGGDAIGSVVLDRTPPSAGSVAIDGGAAYSGDLDVTLALSSSDGPATGTVASGLATVEISNDGFATFASRPYASSVAWQLAPSLPDGARTVSVRFRDKAGNASSPAATAAVVVDTTGPAAAAPALAGNAAARAGYTGTPVVTATVSATDANEGAGKANLQVRLGNDATFAGSSWQSYATQLSWVLPVGDGPKQVWVQFRDAVGNLSTPRSASITLLEAPPSAGAVAVAGGAAATNQQVVTATLQATNADRVLLYVDGQPQAAGWIDLTGTASVDLGATPDEATRTVSATFRSAGGVDGADAITSVVFDRTRPVGSRLVVAGDAAFTGSTAVDLTLSASDGPVTGAVASGLDTVELSNDGFATFESRPYAATVAWTLAAGTGGPRTVSARFRDRAGNLSATPNLSDGITYDRTAPTSPSISLAGNSTADAGYTGTPVVTATLSATDENEGTAKANLQVRVSNDSSFAGASWQAYVPSMTWVLTGGDGNKTVWAQFRDAAGNVSDPASAGIQLLTAPPSGGSIVLDGGKAATAASTTQAAVNATGASWMQFSVNGQAVTGWLAYSTAATAVSLAAVPDQTPATVTVTFRNRGGVEGGAASAVIRSDRTAPLAGALAVTGTLGNGSTSTVHTSTPAVLLRVTPPGADEVEMAIAQAATATTACSASFGTPLWQPVSRTASLVLAGADGGKRACVVFRDAAGNWAAATAATADIVLDTTAPTNPSFVNLVSTTQNAATAPVAGLPTITAATDATVGGVVYQCTGGTGAAYGASWVDCGTSTTLPLAFALAKNTQSTLGVRARDAAHNYSPGSFVQVVHDDVRPMPPNVTGVLTTRDSLAITWEASPDADVESYRVYYGNFAGDFSGTGAAQGPSPVAVPGTGQATQGFVLTGLTTSYPYYVAVEAVDRAGNPSGPSGQRFAQPNDANPRLLSTYGGEQRAVGVRRYVAGNKAFAYVAQNQGLVQLDVTTEAALPGVTGRVSLPNFVPDADAPLVVFDCSRTNRAGTVVTGHCVVAAGSTLEGDFRADGDAYRAPAPVAFFPVNPGGAGTVMTVLPARPHRVVMASVGGKDVLLTVERSGVKAWDLANVKAPRLLASAALDLQTVRVAGEAWGVTGQALLVYAPVRTGTLPTYPPTLYEFGLANVWSGTLAAVDHGWLNDPWGNLMGWSVDPIVPVIGDMQLYIAWNDASGTWLGEWSPGGSGPWDWIRLSDPGAGDPDNRPVAAAAGNMHVYVFCDQPPAMSDPPSGPYAYQVLSDGGLGVTGAITDLTTTARSATVAVYPNTLTAANDEHLLVVDETSPGEYAVQRWHSNNANNAIAYNARSFREVSPVWLAESDRFVFVSDTDKIFTLDAANPLDPRVVATYQDGADVPGFAKLQVHGRYLYAFHTAGARNPGVYILKIRGDGSLEYTGHLSPGMGWNPTDFVVRGRWLYLAMGYIRVYDVSNPAAPAWWYVTASSPGCAAIDARPARVGGTTYEALLYCGNAGTGLGADTFQVWAFTGGATPTALSAAVTLPNDITYYHPKHVTVRGTTAVVSNVLGAHLVDVTNPASPTVGSSPLPASGPVLFQGGYLVGLGKAGAASGPDFLRQQGGANEGTILFSTCAVDDAGAGSLASANGVYYASCQRNGVSVFAASAPGGGSLLARADVSLAWNAQSQALATDGVSAFLSGPEFPSELGRLYSADLRANPSGAPSAPAYATGNLLPGSDAAFHLLAQDGVLHVFEGFYNNTSLLVRSMVPTPVDAAWPTRGSYTVPVVVGQSNGPWNAPPVSDGEIAWASRRTLLEAYDLRYATPSLKTQLNLGLTVSALALSRERLYAGLSTSGQVRVYDTTNGTFGTAPIAVTVTASSGSVTGITGLAAHGQYLFVTYRTNGVDPYGLAVYRLGANRDGSGAAAVARFPSAVPLANPTVAGDVLYVTRDLGLATYDLTPLWQDAVPPVLAGATVSTEPATVQPRFIMDGPWGYLVGGTFRSFDLRQ